MDRKKFLMLLLAMVLTLNSCVTLGVAAAAGAAGYYCGNTSKCVRK